MTKHSDSLSKDGRNCTTETNTLLEGRTEEVTTDGCESQTSLGSLTEKDDSSRNRPKSNEVNSPNVDRGWAWVILCGCFANNLLMVGYLKSFGIMFVEFQEAFEENASMTTLVLGVQQAVFSITSILTLNILIEKVSVRKLMVVGSTLAGLSAILSAFAAEVGFLIFSHGFLFGLGFALTYGPSVVLMTQYFKKYLRIVTAVSNCATSLGCILLPPLFTYLLEQYGRQGTMLLIGSILLQTVIFSSLFRPLRTDKQTDKQTLHVETDSFLSSEKENHRGFKPESKLKRNVSEKSYEITDCENIKTDRMYSSMPVLASSQPLLALSKRYENNDDVTNESSDICCEDKVKRSSSIQTNSQTVASVSDNVTLRKEQKYVTRLETSCFPYVSLPVLAETNPRHSNTLLPGQESASLSVSGESKPADSNASSSPAHEIQNQSNSAERVNKKQNVVLTYLSKVDFALFKQPKFLIIFCFTSCGIVGYAMFGLFIPPLADEKGFSPVQTSTLLSVIAGLDLCSRLLSGIVAELRWMQPHFLLAVVFLVLGVVFQFIVLYTTFEYLMVFVAVFGIIGGSYSSLHPVIVLEFLGRETFPKAFGFVQVFHGASQSINYPVVGMLRDVTGTYNSCFNYLGASLLLGSVALLLEPLVSKREKLKTVKFRQ